MAQTQAGLDGEINALLVSGSDITATQLRQVLHDMNAGIFQSTVSGFAISTANVALTAAQGVATTALRSDAVLALSQSIAPTWTGVHNFANLTVSTNSTTGAVTVGGGVGIAGALNVGTTLNSAGSIYINNAPALVGQRVSGSVSGTVATTDLSMTVPNGASIIGVVVYTTTAFLASGSVTLSAGSAVGDTIYLSGQTIKALGVFQLLLNGSSAQLLGAMPLATPNLFFRITQTGTPSGVGAATIVAYYMVL